MRFFSFIRLCNVQSGGQGQSSIAAFVPTLIQECGLRRDEMSAVVSSSWLSGSSGDISYNNGRVVELLQSSSRTAISKFAANGRIRGCPSARIGTTFSDFFAHASRGEYTGASTRHLSGVHPWGNQKATAQSSLERRPAPV
jgi:hypothetical protein